MRILLYRKQYTHLKVLKLRYCGRDSIIQVRIDLIFIMVPLGEQKQMEEVQTYKTSCRYITYSLMMGEVSPETSPKNTMIQDMINSETTYSRFGKLCLIIKEYIVILFL